MTVEDRLRATTQAVTEAMRPVRPLDLSCAAFNTRARDALPDEAPAGDLRSPDEAPPRRRRSHRSRRWVSWGAPLGAAALVTAVALVLVTLRQAPAPLAGASPAASSTTRSSSAVTSPASLPQYYVALTDVNHTSSSPMEAVVGDDQTGQRLAVITPDAQQNFYGVTAAADDRTFVLMNYDGARKETTWYLLRLTPGAAHPTQLTKLPMKPLAAPVAGLALSPDGRELAVMSITATSKAVAQLLTYSMSSGAVLHDWRTYGNGVNLIGYGNVAALSWVDGDRSVTFRWAIGPKSQSDPGAQTVRTLDVTGTGHDLLADSRLVLQLPLGAGGHGISTTPCANSLAASDGQTVICGTTSYNSPSAACPSSPPSYVSYSTATGKPVQVLWRYQGQCLNGEAELLWTNSSGSQAVALVELVKKVNGVNRAVPSLFGVVAGGRLTALPAPVVHQDAMTSPGGIAF